MLTWRGGGGNDLSYLNHIIIAHYNASYRYGKCLKQAFVSSSTLHNHKKVCIGLIRKKSTGGSGGKPSGGGGDGSHGVLPRLPPRRMARLPPQTPRAPVPLLPHRHYHVTVDERCPTATGPTRTQRTPQVKRRKRRRRTRALSGRVPATRCTRMAATTRLTSTHSTTVLLMSLNSCILLIKDFLTKLLNDFKHKKHTT